MIVVFGPEEENFVLCYDAESAADYLTGQMVFYFRHQLKNQLVESVISAVCHRKESQFPVSEIPKFNICSVPVLIGKFRASILGSANEQSEEYVVFRISDKLIALGKSEGYGVSEIDDLERIGINQFVYVDCDKVPDWLIYYCDRGARSDLPHSAFPFSQNSGSQPVESDDIYWHSTNKPKGLSKSKHGNQKYFDALRFVRLSLD